MIKYLRNVFRKVNSFIQSLNNRQKLALYSIVISIFILITIAVRVNSTKTVIDYKNNDSNMFYYSSNTILDKNIYAQINVIVDDLINKYVSNNISLDNLYEYATTKEYSDTTSKKEFKKSFDLAIKKITSSKILNNKFIPDSITEYKEGYYLIRYVSQETENEEDKVTSIGIYLDSTNKKFYIWLLD